MASFDGNGLVIDRLADIKTEMQDSLKATFGNGINLSETSPFGVLIGIMSERYSQIWELLEAVYEASFVNTAFGIYLDELVALNGIVREQATASVVTLTFTRSNAINAGDVTIPLGTQANASSSTILWSTDAEATILDGTTTISVQATASELGAIGALTGTITQLVAAVPNVASVTNLTDATEGSNQETDAELKIRRAQQLGREGTATQSGIESALQLLDEVRRAIVDQNDTDFTVGDLPPHSIAVSVGTEAGFNLGQISNLVYDAPFVASNSIAVTIDAVPIAASPIAFTVDNATTLAAVAAALQAESVIFSAVSDGTDTIDIQGSTSADLTIASVVTGGVSQPVATFSEISPAGDTLDVIAQTIWDSKAAGIQTYGDLVGTAVDANGDDQAVYFSEVDEVRIWVRLTLTTDADFDPGSETTIAAALEEYANINLTPGVDVLNYKLLCAVSDVDAAGILDIVCENSLDGVSYAAVNRTILASQYASIDSSDVSFL